MMYELNYILIGLAAFFFSMMCTMVVKWTALRFGILDQPSTQRKIHKTPTPLLGGLSIYITFIVFCLFFLLFTDQFLQGHILRHHVWGVLIASTVLLFGGVLDDIYNLRPWQQLLFTLGAIFIVIISGIEIHFVTNPFGGLIYLDTLKQTLTVFNMTMTIHWIADLFAFFWLLMMIYTIKLLDGLDGLATGVSSIGFFIIFLLSLAQGVSQASESLLAIILFGACMGFLLFNLHPAKIFLGEGGSTFLGFMLGILAIISGGKIATALLVLGIPLLDVFWVMIRRVFIDKTSPFKADKKHFHHRLLETGLSYKQVVYSYFFLVFLFGMTTLFLQSRYKLFALGLLVFVMVLLGVLSIWIYHKKKTI